MPESGNASVLLGGALLACVAGMGWLALAMPVHAQQVWGRVVAPSMERLLRILGAIGLLASLVLCLMADHASMAALVWVMALAGSALLVAFILSWRAHWLRMLAPWVREGPSASR